MSTEETSPQLPVEKSLSVGEQLRQTRQTKSLSLLEVVAATKVSRTNLEAIEAMDFGRLPADTFTKGQIMLYAAFLELDGASLAARFFLEKNGGKRSQLTPLQQSLRRQPLMPKKMAEPAHVSSATIASILFLLIVCSFTAFCLYFSWNPFAFLTDKFFPATATKPLFHPADPATSTGGQHNNVQIQAFFKQDCRVLIKLDHKPTFEHTYPKGASVLWEADKQMALEFFQPGSVDLHLNGAPIPFPASSDGRYLLQLPLSPAPSP
ncbi:MAG: helix-turn-helix domain-containing protein [Proteobacteria bacterium]|nr:helix-turn-helix domain-containing protein [Pseudomonadota bacterium]